MDWNNLVDLVNPTRLAVLGIALALTTILGILGSLKAGEFHWQMIANAMRVEANFLWMILGYIAVAVIAALIDSSWEPGVIAAYTVIVAAMIAKLKEQVNYLSGGIIPVINWKLPLESKPG